MHDNDDLAEPDLDTLTRGELAELDGPAATVAGILDEWLHRLHGITSGQHGTGLFLDLLAAEGWRVERIQVPPWPFATPAGPVTVHYWPAAYTPEEAEAAKQAVLETVHELLAEQQAAVVEVTTSEPDAALYLTCQNRHPLAARTTTILENGVRRATHHEIVCPACEADGITEVRLPDLDEGDDDD